MGLKNNESSVSYIKFKEGKFYSSKDKETGYNEIEGYIKNLTVVDQDYKGEVDRKLIVAMIDEEGETYLITMSLKTSYTGSLVSFLKNADLSEKLSLVGTSKSGEDGTMRHSMLVKQNGAFLKGYFTKDNPNGMPKMKELIVNKKKVWDKSDVLEFLENVIVTELTPKVSKVTFQPIKKSEPVEQKVNDTLDTEELVGVEDDDLPF